MSNELVRVLAVDDDEDILTAYGRVLGPDGGMADQVMFQTCRQGEAAVAAVAEGQRRGEPFAVIFLDVRMPPGIDGVETAARIRALDAMVNIVIVTAYTDISPEEISARVLPADKLLFIQKPCHAPEIRQLALALGAKWSHEHRLVGAQRFLAEEVRRRTASLEAANESLRLEVKARREAQAESARQQDRLVQAQKMAAIGGLVSGMAHEVSNPNNVIQLNAGVLARLWERLLVEVDAKGGIPADVDLGGMRYEEVRREVPELIAGIGRAADRISALVRDLKRFVRQEAADPPVAVSPGDVVDSAVLLIEPLLRRSTRRFSVVKSPDLPLIMAYGQQLEQVLVNLLSNACQSLPDANRAICVEVTAEPDGGAVSFLVSDEGQGIRQEHLPHVVEPFFTTRRDSGGTGLGLSISDGIIQRHGGRMVIRSESGKGTTVAFTIPVAELNKQE